MVVIDPGTRARLMLILLGIVLIGVLLIVTVLLVGRWVRRLLRRPAHSIPTIDPGWIVERVASNRPPEDA